MNSSENNFNLGNPGNRRHDAVEQNDAKVTHADHPAVAPVRPHAGVSAGDALPNTARENPANPPAGRVVNAPAATVILEVSAVMQPTTAVVPPVVAAGPVYDSHEPTQHDPDVEMVGDSVSHHDPFFGEGGTHAVGVSIGATAGGAAVGAATGFAAGAVAGPLGAAIGACAGTVVGAIAGGYAGKGIAERINPTTENHYWRQAFASRPYVPRGAKYEEYEPAYNFGIQMREQFLDLTWEEAEPSLQSAWEATEYALVMDWQRARPAVMDAWDRLTPEPTEPEVTEEEKERDE